MLKYILPVLLLIVAFPEKGATNEVQDDQLEQIMEKIAVQERTPKRILNEQETRIANEARHIVAQVMEKNLVKVFAVATAQNRRSARSNHRMPRQDDGDGGFEPQTVLPQVAQVLGAIFSGGINMSGVVDQAVWLIPTALRLQAEGIYRLMNQNSGGGLKSVFSRATTTRRPIREPQPIPPVAEQPEPIAAPPPPPPPQAPPAPIQVQSPPIQVAASTAKPGKKRPYKVGQRVKVKVPAEPIAREEIAEIEKILVQEAIAFEPFVNAKEPRYFILQMGRILSRVDFNATEFAKTVPSIFRGAREAIGVLENLGQLGEGASEILGERDNDDEEE